MTAERWQMAADLMASEASRERDPDRARHMLLEAARLSDICQRDEATG